MPHNPVTKYLSNDPLTQRAILLKISGMQYANISAFINLSLFRKMCLISGNFPPQNKQNTDAIAGPVIIEIKYPSIPILKTKRRRMLLTIIATADMIPAVATSRILSLPLR